MEYIKILILTLILLSSVSPVLADYKVIVNPFNYGKLQMVQDLNSSTDDLRFTFNWSDSVHIAIDFSGIQGTAGNLTVTNETVTLVNKQKFIINESVSVLNHEKTNYNESVVMVEGSGTASAIDYTSLVAISNASSNVWNIGSDANLTSSGVLTAMNVSNQTLYINYTRGLPHARGQLLSTDDTYLRGVMNFSEDTEYSVGSDANVTTAGVLTINNVINGTYQINYTHTLPAHAYGVLANSDNVILTGFHNGTQQFSIGTEANCTLEGVLSILGVGNSTNNSGATVNTYSANYSHSASDYYVYIDENNYWDSNGNLKTNLSDSFGFPGNRTDDEIVEATKSLYVNVSGDNVSGNLEIMFNNLTGVNSIIGKEGNPISIGTGSASSHGLVSSNDLHMRNKLEVDGSSYFDSDVTFYNLVRMADNQEFRFGTGDDSRMDWSTAQTSDTLVWGFGDISRSIIFTTKTNKDKNHDHGAFDDPTIVTHSKTDPDQNNDEFGTWSYSSSDNTSQLDTGVGEVKILPDAISHQDHNVEGDMNIGDTSSLKMFSVKANSTHILIDSTQHLPFHFTGNNTLYFEGGGSLFGNDTSMCLVSPSGVSLCADN